MPIQIDKILSYQGNKYEKTCAIIKYSRYLAQKNDENLEIPITRHTKDKITTIAINDMLNGKITYHMEKIPEDK